MPLAIAPTDTEVEVKRISADEKVKKHLQEIGIIAGSRLTVISSDGGNVILIVKEGRLCLDKVLASKITVAIAA
ncbi:MAG: ferrous iron transport protein A [Clostridia bacterium]|nr:ferrous iron transport protein A [Clostridia bacterium]